MHKFYGYLSVYFYGKSSPARPGPARPGPAGPGPARPGPPRPGPARVLVDSFMHLHKFYGYFYGYFYGKSSPARVLVNTFSREFYAQVLWIFFCIFLWKVQPGPARLGPAWPGPARPGPARPGPARPGPARLAWPGPCFSR